MIKVGDRIAVYQEKMKRKGIVSAIFNKDIVKVIIQHSPRVVACVHIKQCRKLKPPTEKVTISRQDAQDALMPFISAYGQDNMNVVLNRLGFK